jgi:hypothetical protein
VFPICKRSCNKTAVSDRKEREAGVAELADAADSKSAAGHPAWGFNSPLQHQPKFLNPS